MSLNGAKLICLDGKGNQVEHILAKGRKFTIGYYMSCDHVLIDSDAKGVHCEIACDAFGRVTIHNMSEEHPISVNDSVIKIKRPLLNGSKINIFGRNYLWEFPKARSPGLENLDTEASTPPKIISKPEQPPNSCPDLKLHRNQQRRLTIHNFAYCIQAEEITTTTKEKIKTSLGSQSSQFSETDCAQSKGNTPLLVPTMEETGKEERVVTPEPKNRSRLVNVEDTPKVDLINCTLSKEKICDTKEINNFIPFGLSDIVITSFSPRETGVRIEKSFAAVLKPRTPRSQQPPMGGTPWKTNNGDRSLDFIDFSTPATTSKKSNSSMHLIDLTTPGRMKLAASIGPVLDNNALKINATSADIKKSNESGVSLMGTPDVVKTMSTSGSVVSVDSTDSSSVVEISDSSSPSCSTAVTAAASTTCVNTPKKVFSPKSLTPKRTPQSLMKRALLTSAKKRGITPVSTVPNVPRSSVNAIPSRRDICTPATPSPRRIQFVAQRLSMTTPSRRSGVMSRLKLDASPTTPNSSHLLKSSNTKRSPPISSTIGKLSTSTPLRRSCSMQCAPLKTSPELHKVRKFIGGTPLTSHISKIRKSFAMSRSPTDSNAETPSTSAKIPNRSAYVPSPANARARAIAASIIKSPQLPKKAEETKTDALVPEKPNETILNKSNELNRTFTLDSSDRVVSEVPDTTAKNVTFSPDKKEVTANKMTDPISPEIKAEGGATTTKEIDKLNATFSPDKSYGLVLEHERSRDLDRQETVSVDHDSKDNADLSTLNKKDANSSIILENNPKDLDPKDLEEDHDHKSTKDLSVINDQIVMPSPKDFTSGDKLLSMEQTISSSSFITKGNESNANDETTEGTLTKDDEQENAALLEQIEDVLNKSDELKKHLEEIMEPSTVSIDVRPNTVGDCEIIEKLSEELKEVEELEKCRSNKLQTNVPIAQKPDSSSLIHEADHYFIQNPSDTEIDDTSPCYSKAHETEHIPDIKMKTAIIPEAISENASSNFSVIAEEQMPEKLTELNTNEGLTYESAETLLKKVKVSKVTRAHPGTPNLRGIKEMLRTPKVEKQIDTSILKGVQNILRSPERHPRIDEELETSYGGVAALLQTPTSSLPNEKNLNVLTPRRSARRASMAPAPASQVLTPKGRTPRRASVSTVSTNLLTPKRIMTRRASVSIDKPLPAVHTEPQQKEVLINSIFEEEIDSTDNDANTNSAKVVPLESQKSAELQKDNVPQRMLAESIRTELKEVLDDMNIFSVDSNTSDVMIENADIDSQSDMNAILEEDRICDIVHDSVNITLKDDKHDQGRDNACKIVDVSDYEYGKEIKGLRGDDSKTDTYKSPIISEDSKTTTQCPENKMRKQPQSPKRVPMLDKANYLSLIETSEIKLQREVEFICSKPSTSTNTPTGSIRSQFKCPPRSSTPNTSRKEKALPSVDDNTDNKESNLSAIQSSSSEGRVSKFLIERGLLPKPDNFNSNIVESNEIEDEGLDKFFSTPRAKDMMILTSPKSVNLKENIDSVESEEYEMSTTNLDNLDDMFKTPVSTRYTHYIENFNGTENSFAEGKEGKDLQKLSPEEAFDQLVGRNSVTRTPEPKVYAHKLLSNSPSVVKSPFSATDIISDLPKTDIQEWVDSLEDVEIPKDLELQEESIFANDVDVSSGSREISRDPLSLSTMELTDSITKRKTDEASTSIFDIHAVSHEADPLTDSVCLLTGEESDVNLHRLGSSGDNETATIISPKKDDADISGIDLLEQSEDSLLSGPPLTETESSVSKTLVEEADLNSNKECLMNFADEFKNFNNHESRKGVMNRSITPNNCTRAVIVPRRSLGNCEGVKITIDFQSEKLETVNEELAILDILEQETGTEINKLENEKTVVGEGMSNSGNQTQSETTTDPSETMIKAIMSDHKTSVDDGVIMLEQVDVDAVGNEDSDNLGVALEENVPNVMNVEFSDTCKRLDATVEDKKRTDSAISSIIVDETDIHKVSKEQEEIDNNVMPDEVNSSSKEIVPYSAVFTEDNLHSSQKDNDDDTHQQEHEDSHQEDNDKEKCSPTNIEIVEKVEVIATFDASPEELTIGTTSLEEEKLRGEIATEKNAIENSQAAKEISQAVSELRKESAQNENIENVQLCMENVDVRQLNTANDENKDLVIKGSAKVVSKCADVKDQITLRNMETNSEITKSPKVSTENIYEHSLETVANEEPQGKHKEKEEDDRSKHKIDDDLMEKKGVEKIPSAKQKFPENRTRGNRRSVVNENEKSTNNSNDGGSSDLRRNDEVDFVNMITENEDNSSNEVTEEAKNASFDKTTSIILSNDLLQEENKDTKNEICEEKITLKATVTDLRKGGKENNSLQTELPQGINDSKKDDALNEPLKNLSLSGHTISIIEKNPSEQSPETECAKATKNCENQLKVDEVVENEEQKEIPVHPVAAEVDEKSRPKRARVAKRKVPRGESEEPETIVKKMPIRRGGQRRKVVEANIESNIIADPAQGSTEDLAKTPTKNVNDCVEELVVTPKIIAVEVKETTSSFIATPFLGQNIPQGMLSAVATNSCTKEPEKPLISERFIDSLVTSRGRTRKPTARARQFLEEERAKASTPKRRQLLAQGGKGSATPKRTPRNRKGKLNIESELLASSTPHQLVSRDGGGRALAAEINNYSKIIEEKDVLAEHTAEKKDEDPLNRLSGLVSEKMLQQSTLHSETNITIATPQSIKPRTRNRKVLNTEKSLHLNSDLEHSTIDHLQKSSSRMDEEVKSSTLDIIHEDAKPIQRATGSVQAPLQKKTQLRRKVPTTESEKNNSVTTKKPVKQNERKRKLIAEVKSELLSDSGGLEEYIDRSVDEIPPQKVPGQRRRKASPIDFEKVISTTGQRATRGGRGRKVITETTSEQSHSELENFSHKESSNNIEEEGENSKKARGRARKNLVKDEIYEEGEDHNELHDIVQTSQTDIKRPTRRARNTSTNNKKKSAATSQKKIVGRAGHNDQIETESDTVTDTNVIKSEAEENPLSMLANISKEEEKSIRSSRTRKCNDFIKKHAEYSEARDDEDNDEPIKKKITKVASEKSLVVEAATTSRRTARKGGQFSAIDTLAEHNDKLCKESAETGNDKPKSSRARRGGAKSKQAQYHEEAESMSSVSTIQEHTDHEKEKPKPANLVGDQKEEVDKKNAKTGSDRPKSSRARRGGASSKQPKFSEEVESMSSASTIQENADHVTAESKSTDTVVEHKKEAVEKSTEVGNDKLKKSRARRGGVGKKQPQHNEDVDSVSSISTGQEHAVHEMEKSDSTKTRRGKVIQDPIVEEKEEIARPIRSRRGEGKKNLKELSKEDKRQEHKIASTVEGKIDHGGCNPDEHNEELTELKIEKSTTATVGTKRSAANSAETSSTADITAPKRNRRNEVPAEKPSISPQHVKTRGGARSRKVTFEAPVIIVEPTIIDDGASKRIKRTTRKK